MIQYSRSHFFVGIGKLGFRVKVLCMVGVNFRRQKYLIISGQNLTISATVARERSLNAKFPILEKRIFFSHS